MGHERHADCAVSARGATCSPVTTPRPGVTATDSFHSTLAHRVPGVQPRVRQALRPQGPHHRPESGVGYGAETPVYGAETSVYGGAAAVNAAAVYGSKALPAVCR
eukprot:2154824-Rhodomonas_salina.1